MSLSWSETGTWITGDTTNLDNSITYITDSIDMGRRIDVYPDTVVLYNSTAPTGTVGNLSISYLVSEDNIIFYEIPYTLIPIDNYRAFPTLTITNNPYQDGFYQASLNGAPRYYKTKVVLKQGEFYGVKTKWNTREKVKSISNYNMWSGLYVPDEDDSSWPAGVSRTFLPVVGSSNTIFYDSQTIPEDLSQAWVRVGGTLDPNATSIFAGNLVGQILPNHNVGFSKIISAVGKTAKVNEFDIQPSITINKQYVATRPELLYGNFGASALYENGRVEIEGLDGYFYWPTTPFNTEEHQRLTYCNFGNAFLDNDPTGDRYRLLMDGNGNVKVFNLDNSSVGNNGVIYSGTFRMNWDIIGYPELIFNEEQGTITPIEEV
jgi:hypothetical protein